MLQPLTDCKIKLARRSTTGRVFGIDTFRRLRLVLNV